MSADHQAASRRTNKFTPRLIRTSCNMNIKHWPWTIWFYLYHAGHCPTLQNCVGSLNGEKCQYIFSQTSNSYDVDRLLPVPQHHCCGYTTSYITFTQCGQVSTNPYNNDVNFSNLTRLLFSIFSPCFACLI